MQRSTSISNVQEKKEKYKHKRRRTLRTKKKRAKEKRKRITRCESPSLTQSKREPEKRASIWSSNLSKSSKVRRLRSLKIHDIKYNGIKFQM